MGLDMNLFWREKKENTEKDDPEDNSIEIMCWRKHNALHSWMEDLWRKQGGEGVFNCIDLVLTKNDLIRLGNDIMNEKLVPTGGFFFGNTEYDPLERAGCDLEAIGKALYHIKQGKEVYYYSWW